MEPAETRNTGAPEALSPCEPKEAGDDEVPDRNNGGCGCGVHGGSGVGSIYAGADPGGVGVHVGPFGVGVGPRYGGGMTDIIETGTIQTDTGPTGRPIAVSFENGSRRQAAG